MADKFYFMCELSWEMLKTEKMNLNYRLFPERLRNLFGKVVSEEKDLDHYHYDMMGNTLLIRNDEGDYSPAHRSLLEFFVAYKAVAELGALPTDFIEVARSQSNINEHGDPKEYTWGSYFRRDTDEDGRVRQIHPLRNFRVEDSDMTLASLGCMGDAVLRFIHEITNIDETRVGFHKLVSEVLDGFRDQIRDPDKQQDIIRFVLKFRRLSQAWEEEANQGDTIRRFWEDHLKREQGVSKALAEVEPLYLDQEGADPIRIDMVRAPAGSFLMGDEKEGLIRVKTISESFMISTVPVTNALYSAVTGDAPPSRFKGDEQPVERVSWVDAVRFCNNLSERMNLEPAYVIDGERLEWLRDRTGFRLPTETEWEYACRAGSTTCFACGDLESGLDNMGWYDKNSGMQTHPVGQKQPNSWGLFDMHGNVWEWTWDLYKEGGSGRVVRGGSWDYYAQNCRSAFRDYDPPGFRNDYVGFRLSR